MKVVILCGGKGTRIGELTQGEIPKPMIRIGPRPILHHIMEYYSAFGYNDFVLCAGYLSWEIKNYFLGLREREQDLTIDLKTGEKQFHSALVQRDWRITIAETGVDTMTAGRLRRIMPYLPLAGDQSILLTYGDGLSDINLDALVDFHRSHGKGVTMSGICPPGRFGEMKTVGDQIASWSEKPQSSDHYINGGYMVIRRDWLNTYVGSCSDSVMLERSPFEEASRDGEMMLFRHDGFWQCMDTPRDYELLSQLWASGRAPWVTATA